MPYGHPDLLLGHAATAGLITTDAAELISATRFGDALIEHLAAERGVALRPYGCAAAEPNGSSPLPSHEVIYHARSLVPPTQCRHRSLTSHFPGLGARTHIEVAYFARSLAMHGSHSTECRRRADVAGNAHGD